VTSTPIASRMERAPAARPRAGSTRVGRTRAAYLAE
jgi:hypothetical protein